MAGRQDRYLIEAKAALDGATGRLDRLNRLVERTRGLDRRAWQRDLDHLRGACNRVAARIEDVRRAPEDAWQTGRMPTDTALAALLGELERLEGRITPLAA